MTKMMTFLVLMLCSISLKAQEITAPDQSQAVSAPTISGTATDVAILTPVLGPLDWYKIGGTFGSGGSWQFGLDKSPTASGCVEREDKNGQFLVGPCRDILLLAKNGEPRAHLGFAIMYNAEHGNAAYTLRAGVNVGPIAKTIVAQTLGRLPYLENLANFKAPPFVTYLGHVTTVDYSVGYRPVHTNDVIGNITHGVMVKVDLPLNDLYQLIKIGF